MKTEPKLFYPTKYCNVRMYSKKMRLGSCYLVKLNGKWHLCRFIKVTRKGFNLLDVNTNRCLKLNGHLYAPKWRDKKDRPPQTIPDDEVWFKVNVPEWITIGEHINDEEEAG
jgi:hypothetical protein